MVHYTCIFSTNSRTLWHGKEMAPFTKEFNTTLHQKSTGTTPYKLCVVAFLAILLLMMGTVGPKSSKKKR